MDISIKEVYVKSDATSWLSIGLQTRTLFIQLVSADPFSLFGNVGLSRGLKSFSFLKCNPK